MNKSEAALAMEQHMVAGMKAGDPTVFRKLVERCHTSLVRMAGRYVKSLASAEDAAQETWLAAVRNIGAFRGESSLKTWLFQIAVNQAKAKGQAESRTTTFSQLEPDDGPYEPTVESAWFDPRGMWLIPPEHWSENPSEKILLDRELRSYINRAIDELPPNLRAVITLRDIEEMDASEVCNILSLTDSNQRIMLHRARTRVRHALATYYTEERS